MFGLPDCKAAWIILQQSSARELAELAVKKTAIDLRIRTQASRANGNSLRDSEVQRLFLAPFPAFSRNLFFSFLGMNEHIVGIAESLFLGLPDLAECPPVL